MSEEIKENPAGGDAAVFAPSSFRNILGEKMGMTQMFHPNNKCLYGVTAVKAGPCRILGVKIADGPDGYSAVQLAFGQRKEKNVPKALLGQFKKAGIPPARFVREIRVRDAKDLKAGQTILPAGLFKTGDYVDVRAVSKGKGFAGVMKRHGFRGLPASHGASDKERSPGSLASRRSLGRVLPGQRMAGHAGHVNVTVQHVEVVSVDPQKNLVYLAGSVPGPRGGLVTLAETVKARKFRVEIAKPSVKKDKMGNIIGKKPSLAKK